MRKDGKEWWTVSDVADVFVKSYPTVDERLKRGLMPPQTRIGGRWYWSPDQADELRAALVRKRPTPARKLTPDEVKVICDLRACGFTQRELGKLYGVTHTRIRRLLRGAGLV